MPKAKGLDAESQQFILEYLKTTRFHERNKVIFLLSVRAGLRAGEIAQITWRNVLAANKAGISQLIRIPNHITKNKSCGRDIFMSDDLRLALKEHLDSIYTPKLEDRVVLNQSDQPFCPIAIAKLFWFFKKRTEIEGFSSHSGRRTFITNAARKINLCGGSIYDVSRLAGHKNIAATQVYIEANLSAQQQVVNMI